MILLSLTALARAADCPEPVDLARLEATLGVAEQRWREADEDALFGDMAKVFEDLNCLDEPITPALAARAHVDAGLWFAFIDKPEQATLAFASAKLADPDARIPDDLIPASHPSRTLFQDAQASDGTTKLPRALDGKLYLDGRVGTQRPELRPVYLQYVSDEQVISAYLQGDKALPDYPVDNSKLRSWHLAVPAGVALAGGGAMMAMARQSQQEFLDSPPDSKAALQELYDKNQTQNTAGAALLGVGGALAAGAVVVVVF